MTQLERIEDAPRDGEWIVLVGRTLGEPAAISAFWFDGGPGGADAGWYSSEAANSPVTCFNFVPSHFLRVVWP